MTGHPKYPGDWVASQLLEGKMRTHNANVAEIAAAIGSSVMPDNDQWVNRFTVPSASSNAVYIVSQRRTDGSWGCSCPGWRMHSNRQCKHITDIQRRLAGLDTTAEVATAQGGFASDLAEMLASARAACAQRSNNEHPH